MIRPSWTRSWESPDGRLVVERSSTDGVVRHRFRSDPHGNGAVACATRDDRTLFIDIHRPLVERRLLELPRGQAEEADRDAVDTALRELREETGYVASSGIDLGTIWPDTGLCGDGVHVVVVADPAPSDLAAEFPHQHWMTPEEIVVAIADGRIRDGISLGALTLAGRLGTG